MSVDELEMGGEEEMKGEIAEDILGLSITEALLYLFKKLTHLLYFLCMDTLPLGSTGTRVLDVRCEPPCRC